MSRDIKLSALRLPLDLHTKIVAESRQNGRSQHAEMLYRMEQSFSEPTSAGHTMVEAAELEEVVTKVVTTCFTSLEERVLAMLDHPLRHVYSVTIPDDATEANMKALRAGFPHSGSYDELSDLWRGVKYQRFDFPGRPGATSPTGRLSESQPEMQDLTAVSGMSTLAASVDRLGVCPECGTVTKLNLYHTGGFTGLPEGELPPILERGERVMPLPKAEPQPDGVWLENTGVEPEGLTDKSVVDFRLSNGNEVLGHRYKQGSSRGDAIWPIKPGRAVNCTHWRIAK